MKNKLTSQEQKKLYHIGWCLILIIAILTLVLNITHLSLQNIIPPCLLRRLTGLYCPGCGGTRAVIELFHGHIWKSFLYHPIVVYTTILFAWFMISNLIQNVSKDKLHIGMHYRDIYVYIGIGILLVNVVIRDYLLIGYGITL